MSLSFDDLTIQHQLWIGAGTAPIFGVGQLKVRGVSWVEGPSMVGDGSQYSTPNPFELGNLMVSQCTNSDMKPTPFYSLFAKLYARIKGFLKVDTLLTVETIKTKIIFAEVVMAKVKNFVIDHPSKSGKMLVHSCLEGPENAVYIRGRVSGKVIKLPEYWKNLIDPRSISIILQPIGAHQNVIIKRYNIDEVHLQASNAQPIDCFYHIYAERIDLPPLETEIDK
jgi:hypothetical protein